MKPMIHYEFQRLVFLEKTYPNSFGGHDHLVLVFLR